MRQHHVLDYVEFPCRDLTSTKLFFEAAFDWVFTDYGEEYTAFSCSGLEGGFYFSEQASASSSGSALLVFYSDDLEASQAAVIKHGATIVKPIFEFPGGRRFHFAEPSGNEFAVWSEQ